MNQSMELSLSNLRLQNDPTVKAVASVLIDGAFAIHEIKVLDMGDRIMVVMPNRQDNHGRYRDIVHPISSKVRATLEELIITEYNIRRNDQ